MTAAEFLDIPTRKRQEILDRVRGEIATFKDGRSYLRNIHDAELEDICRWVVDAYLDVWGDDEMLNAVDAARDETYMAQTA